MEIDAPTQPAGELGGCLRRPVCAPARRTARGLSWSTLAYFCDIVVGIAPECAHSHRDTQCVGAKPLKRQGGEHLANRE